MRNNFSVYRNQTTRYSFFLNSINSSNKFCLSFANNLHTFVNFSQLGNRCCCKIRTSLSRVRLRRTFQAKSRSVSPVEMIVASESHKFAFSVTRFWSIAEWFRFFAMNGTDFARSRFVSVANIALFVSSDLFTAIGRDYLLDCRRYFS